MKIKIILFAIFIPVAISAQSGRDSLVFDSLQKVIFENLFDEGNTSETTALQYDSLAKTIGAPFFIAKARNLLGLEQYYSGNNIVAIELYLEALEIFSSIPDTFFTGLVSNNIGAAYSQRQDATIAIDYYNAAVEKFLLVNDSTWIANCYNNIAIQENILKRRESSLENLRKAKAIFEAKKDSFSYGYVIANESSILANMEEFSEAKTIAKNYLNNFRNHFDEESLAVAHSALSQVYLSEKSLDKAQFHADEALRIRQAKGLVNMYNRSYLTLSHIAEEKKEYRQALEYHKLHKLYLDSLWQKEKDNTLNDLIAQYEFKEKDEKINKLENEKQIQELKVGQLRAVRNSYIVGLLSLLSLIIALLIYLRQRNKKNKILRDKNKIIQQNLVEKENLLKEIHHRVKNNLQVVSSLLSLQSRSTKDDVAVKALIDGKNRVHSMALIHQHLYSGENITKIEMKPYIEQLCQQIFHTYMVTSKNIELKLDIESIDLDISTVVPIGLIMNELITNSCKYAFEESQKGEIYVSLKKLDESLQLIVKDSGTKIKSKTTTEGFGSRLIAAFAKKLDASVSITIENGYQTELLIKRFEEL